MLKPRENTKLFGYKDLEEKILKEFQDGKLHHSLLITGKKGIGKATFAYRLANRILSGEQNISAGLFGEDIVNSDDLSEDDPTFMKIKAGSHTDLMSVEIKIDEKTKKPKSAITVDSVREIRDFLNLTPAISNHKIVIIDSADEMNVEASNAILKILEEPPKNSFMLLISHNPAKLLDTIRSRCREVKVPSLSYEDWKLSLEYSVKNNPLYNLENEDLESLRDLSDGSVHTAIELCRHRGLELYEKVLNILAKNNTKDKDNFASEVSEKTFPFWMCEYIMSIFFVRAIKFQSLGKLDKYFVENEEAVLCEFVKYNSTDRLFEKYQKIMMDLKNTGRLNLSKKHIVLSILNHIND